MGFAPSLGTLQRVPALPSAVALGSSSHWHPRSGGSLRHGHLSLYCCGGGTGHRRLPPLPLHHGWGEGLVGCWVPAWAAPALRPSPPGSQRGPVEGKPSPGAAAGFYYPENESQPRYCLSGERGHVTAQETAAWERQLVKKGKKPVGAGSRGAGRCAGGGRAPRISRRALGGPLAQFRRGTAVFWGGFHRTWSTAILLVWLRSFGLCRLLPHGAAPV